MERFDSLLKTGFQNLSQRLKRAFAILALAALVGANLQLELQRFENPPQASAQNAAQCDDGIDNDGDGLYDMQDTGCSDFSDDSEFNADTGNNGNNGNNGGGNNQQQQDQNQNQNQQQQAPSAQCDDGVDNDGDGYTDMSDQGCNSPNDDDEFNIQAVSSAPQLTACSDGIDNDGDGFTDLQDPGCSGPNDDNEFNQVVISHAQCDDGIDNDGDGDTDMADLGCSSPSDNSEFNVVVAPTTQCNDNVDNDGDGLKDYPQDPGCSSATDDDEFNIVPASSSSSVIIVMNNQCSDGVDNDGDNKIDYPQDPGCTSPTDNDEFNLTIPSSSSSTGTSSFQCSDGVDNDGDNKIDYPQDPGCTGPTDDDEFNLTIPSSSSVSSGRTYQCSDFVDNDGDNKIDSQDPGCHTDNNPNNPNTYVPTDDDEFNLIVVSSSSVSSTPNGPDLSLSKSGPATVLRGTTLTYILSVTNSGPATAHNVIITDPYPASLTFNANASDNRCSLLNGQVRCFFNDMAPGTQTITLNFSSAVISPCLTEQLYNTAIVSTSDTDPNGSNNTSNTVTTMLTCPVVSSSSSSSSTPGNNDLSLSKSGPSSVLHGGTLVYTLSVTNSGPATAQNVIITDPFPQGFIFNASASDSRCSLLNGQVRCTLGSMAPGTQTISLNFSVPNTTPCTTESVYNTAIVSTSSNDTNGSNNTSNTVTTVLTCPTSSSSSSSVSSISETPDLTITKTVSTPSVAPQNIVRYSITARNSGLQTAHAENVVITDTVPANLTFLPIDSDPRCSLQGSVVTCPIGTLGYGQSTSVGLAFFVGASAPCTSVVVNTASVATSTQETNTGNNQASAQFVVLCGSSSSSSSSSIPSSSSSSSTPNETGCIEILKQTYNPQGNPFSQIAPFIFNLDGNMQSTVNDNSGHARFLNVPVGVHSVSEVVTAGWSQISVQPQNGIVTVFGSQNNAACSPVTFQNKLNSISSSSSSSSDTTADLSITKTANPSTVSVGSNTVFTVTVHNNSNLSAQNVIVNDPLPSGLTYVSNVTTSGFYSGSQWNIGTLTQNGVATLQITATVNVNGSVTNTATVTSSTPDNNQGNNTASATVNGTQSNGCIDIYKTATDRNGNQIYSVPSFTFSLDNNRTTSNDSAGHARFDNVPNGSHTISEYNQNGWTMDTISPNGGNVNVVTGSCVTVNIRNRQTNDNNNASFTISKTDGRSTVRPGDRLTYTITVRNNNSGTSNNVNVRDLLPNYLRAISASDNGRINGRTVTWDNIYMAGYSTRTFRLDVEVSDNARGTITNEAQVNGRVAYDTDVVNENSNNNGNLDLSKDASTSEVFPGGMIEYTVRVHNNSNDTLRNVRVIDNLPSNVSVIDDGNSDSGNNDNLEWDIGSLSPNASRVIRYRISIGNSYGIGSFVRNDAEATADNGDTEHASSVVQVIGNLPQTGFMNADLTGTPSLALKPITGGASGSGGEIPAMFWIALAGLSTGGGAGFLRKFMTGGI